MRGKCVVNYIQEDLTFKALVNFKTSIKIILQKIPIINTTAAATLTKGEPPAQLCIKRAILNFIDINSKTIPLKANKSNVVVDTIQYHNSTFTFTSSSSTTMIHIINLL